MKTKEFDKIKPYTYLLIRKFDNKKYYGVRWANKNPAIEDVGKIYFTSSKIIKPDFKKNPSNYNIRLSWTFDTVHEAREYEKRVNKKNLKKPAWLNKNASLPIYNEVHPLLGKKRSDEFKKKLSEWNKINS